MALVFSLTGVLHEALQAARSVDDWWENQVYLLFIRLSISNHDL
jgi:hypothetical protein